MAQPEIRIETGTPKAQALIRAEFGALIELIKGNLRSWFDLVIIPEDFEAAIQRWSADEDFRSRRGNRRVMARTLTADGKTILIINSDMYAHPYDTHVRFHYLLHETFHLLRSRRKPASVELPALDKLYLDEVSAYYEEYCAERYSLILCRQLLTQRSERSLEDRIIIYSGHHEIVSRIARDLAQIQTDVRELMNRGRGDQFLQRVKPITESRLMSYFYLLAFHQEAASPENEGKFRLPDFYLQADFQLIARLFHDRYPDPLPAAEAAGAIKKIYRHFGFTLEATDTGDFYISVSIP